MTSVFTLQITFEKRYQFVSICTMQITFEDKRYQFHIVHCRRPGLILETVAPPLFLVRAMSPTGSSQHPSMSCRPSLFTSWRTGLNFFSFLQKAPGWPWSLARGLGGEGAHRWKDILHWSQHKVVFCHWSHFVLFELDRIRAWQAHQGTLSFIIMIIKCTNKITLTVLIINAQADSMGRPQDIKPSDCGPGPQHLDQI